MTATTATTATQADLDAQTYQAYLDNGQNKAATARALGVNASTVADRIKRHQARTEQDEATEQASPHVADPANPKEQRFTGAVLGVMSGTISVDEAYAELTGKQAPAELPDPVHGGDVFARIEASNPEVRLIDETGAALAAVREEAAQVRALGGVPNPNEAHAVAIKLHAARKNGEPEDTEADPQLQAERDALMDQSCIGCGVEVSEDGAEIEHLDNCPDNSAPVAVTVDGAVVAMVEHHDIVGPVDPEIASILAAGAAGGLVAAAEQAGEVLASATEAPAKAEKTLVAECVRCGFHFSRPQVRQTCQSDKACQRRQAAKVAA